MVLLSFVTVAVHWEVPESTISVGTQEIVIVGLVVVLEPQELRIANAAISPKQKRPRSQRSLPRHKRKIRSSTRNPPARRAPIFPRKMQFLPRIEPSSIPQSEGTSPFIMPTEKLSTWPVDFRPLDRVFPCLRITASAHLQPA